MQSQRHIAAAVAQAAKQSQLPPSPSSRYGSFMFAPVAAAAPVSSSVSSSPPVPDHIRSFSYQRTTPIFSPPPPSSTQVPSAATTAVVASTTMKSVPQSPAASSVRPAAITLAPSSSILAPPLSPPQQEQLYSYTKADYLAHLNDLLRLRVLAAILIFLCLLVCIYFAQRNWLIIFSCMYLMASSICAIRGSSRAEKKFVDYFWLSLIGWMAIYVVSFIIYMFTIGMAPTARDRCGVLSFVSSYGSNCASSPSARSDCFNHCVWEMRINLLIETFLVAGMVAFVILFLIWDSLRISSALLVWSHHPLLQSWHSEFVVLAKYADPVLMAAQRAEEQAIEDAEAEAEAKKKAEKQRKAEEDGDEEEEEEGEKQVVEEKTASLAVPVARKNVSATYGSGAVGEAASGATTRKGPLGQLYREQQAEASEKERKKQ